MTLATALRPQTLWPALLRRAPLVVLLVSAAVLGGALASQLWGGLYPCILCLYQRWPHAIAIALAVLALLLPGRPRVQAGLLALAGLALWAGAGIAGYHVGVEQQWWQSTAACDGARPLTGGSADALRQELLAMPVVRCDVVSWSFLGISMAGYNLAISLALGAVALFGAKTRAAG